MASNVALTGLAKELEARAQQGAPIRIGLIGCGEMGTDIVTRASLMSGIEVAAISDIRAENAVKLLMLLIKRQVIAKP